MTYLEALEPYLDKINELTTENEQLKKQLKSMRATNELKYKDYENRMSKNATLICNMAAARDALQEQNKKYYKYLVKARALIIKLKNRVKELENELNKK